MPDIMMMKSPSTRTDKLVLAQGKEENKMKRLISSLLIFSFLFSILSFRVSAEVYTLAPGDILEVKIIGQAKFDTKQSIAPDGKINLPLLGRVAVSGYTMDKLTEYLNEEFSLYLVKPQVII